MVIRRSAASRDWLCNLVEVEPSKVTIMNPQRCATVAAALTVVLAGWVVAWLAGFSSAVIENAGAAPILDRPASSLTTDAEHGRRRRPQWATPLLTEPKWRGPPNR